MVKKIVNLTPHKVTILDEGGDVKAEFLSEGVARASQEAELVGDVNGIDIVKMRFGEPQDLPDPEEGVFYIVSVITANAAKASGRGADDLLITADPVRDADGRIIGCKMFAVVN